MSKYAFLAESVPSFGDTLRRVELDPSFPGDRRSGAASGLRRTIKWAAQSSRSLPPPTADDLPFTRRTLDELYRRFVPATLGKRGVSTKSLENAHSECRFVLRFYGLAGERAWAPFTEEVAHLDALLEGSYLRLQLRRGFRFLSSIGETAFTDAILERFFAALNGDPSVRDPDKLLKMTARGWNKAASSVPGWPQTLVSVPLKRRSWGKPWSNYPPLKEEAIAFLHRTRSHSGLFKKQIKAPLLSPATIESQLNLIRIMASELELAGTSSDKISGLRSLVVPLNFLTILQRVVERAGGRVNHLVHLKGTVLIKIARKAKVLSDDELQMVETAYAELRSEYKEFKKTHVERSHQLIEQYDDPRVMDALLDLASEVEAEVNKAPKITRAVACLMKCSVILALWLEAPLRSLNLRTLIFERHFFPALLEGEETLRISIPATEVKNNEPLDHLLSPDVAGKIRRFMTKYRSKLLLSPSDYLFPGLNGRVISTQTLRSQMRRLIAKRLKRDFTPHLIRNLVTKIVLDEDPEAIETACSQLGHKTDHMVRRVYKQRRSRAGQQRYLKLLSARRLRVPGRKAVRSQRNRRG